MNEIRLENTTVKKRECRKVYFRNIAIGLIYEEETQQWRYSSELKGEFWSLETYEDSDSACQALVDKRRSLDDYRLSQLK